MQIEEQELKHTRIKLEDIFLLTENLITMISGDMALILNVVPMILIYQDICLVVLLIDSIQIFL